MPCPTRCSAGSISCANNLLTETQHATKREKIKSNFLSIISTVVLKIDNPDKWYCKHNAIDEKWELSGRIYRKKRVVPGCILLDGMDFNQKEWIGLDLKE
ncbi:MAG: hypothetical protein IJB58_07295 [Bacteroidales bacterium]|nr:hypothetical protein [Bacteroidales bacterium]